MMCFIVLSVYFLNTPSRCFGFETLIDVAPNVLNLQNRGQVVTVHTDIEFGLVDVSTVYLNGVSIDSWKADDRGFFVAKFYMEAIKELPLLIDEYNTFKIVGLTTDNLSFWGEQDILVINNVPPGR